ncbi:hypothetical protein E2C01_097887 [Portunus trituberculatus]|uniref:Uncharacterized protein n=1 Tax=Portunus trituberculatus TaxID=210409 RepID=A0A5B7K5J2_PORTR|nr:hypothetical protein [Portunus trituberculatus]
MKRYETGEDEDKRGETHWRHGLLCASLNAASPFPAALHNTITHAHHLPSQFPPSPLVSAAGSAGAVAASSDNGGGLTVFRCSSSSSSLVSWLQGIQKVLTQGYSPVTHRNVLVACSASRTSEIFTQIRQVGLESPSVHWYVVLQEEEATLDLFSGLREGTQVRD